MYLTHGYAIKWKHFPRYWAFVWGIHRSSVNFLHKGQWRGALMFSWIYAWIYGWVNNREAGDLRRHRTHYDVIVMKWWQTSVSNMVRHTVLDIVRIQKGYKKMGFILLYAKHGLAYKSLPWRRCANPELILLGEISLGYVLTYLFTTGRNISPHEMLLSTKLMSYKIGINKYQPNLQSFRIPGSISTCNGMFDKIQYTHRFFSRGYIFSSRIRVIILLISFRVTLMTLRQP